MKTEKRVFGWVEAVFDMVYLLAACIIAARLLLGAYTPARMQAGVMALVLAAGDGFHLVPRMMAILTGRQADFLRAMGRGKQITSISMTLFYVLLWHIGALYAVPKSRWMILVYVLAAVRTGLCLFPQNRWLDRAPPVRWAIYRNIPFMLLGAAVAAYFACFVQADALRQIPLAITLSFVFYLPVVLWAQKNPKIGMLMLPKTCVYLWMLALCLHL